MDGEVVNFEGHRPIDSDGLGVVSGSPPRPPSPTKLAWRALPSGIAIWTGIGRRDSGCPEFISVPRKVTRKAGT